MFFQYCLGEFVEDFAAEGWQKISVRRSREYKERDVRPASLTFSPMPIRPFRCLCGLLRGGPADAMAWNRGG